MTTERENGKSYQTIMLPSEMDELKLKTQTESTKDALSIAVEHYLQCKKV
jgi:hypothetical protein